MKQIEIHSYVTQKEPTTVVECYVYRPEDESDNDKLSEMGWNRKDLFQDDYFYYTTKATVASNTKDEFGLEILKPATAPIWKI